MDRARQLSTIEALQARLDQGHYSVDAEYGERITCVPPYYDNTQPKTPDSRVGGWKPPHAVRPSASPVAAGCAWSCAWALTRSCGRRSIRGEARDAQTQLRLQVYTRYYHNNIILYYIIFIIILCYVMLCCYVLVVVVVVVAVANYRKCVLMLALGGCERALSMPLTRCCAHLHVHLPVVCAPPSVVSSSSSSGWQCERQVCELEGKLALVETQLQVAQARAIAAAASSSSRRQSGSDA
jgi:hypothetical protein